MDIHVSLKARGDLSVQIYRQLVEAIVDGRLRRGGRVPPTRELARRLSVSRNTVVVAYERLAAEGFLVSRVGDGTFIAADRSGVVRDRRTPAGSARPRTLWAAAGADLVTAPAPVAYDFRVGAPDPRLFPLAEWRQCVARELRPAAVLAPEADEGGGHAGLRRAIARHIGVSRAVQASADDVLVTYGTQQALDLIGRVVLEPGTCVAVEEPGYIRARQLFTRLGAHVVGVPVDGEGLDVSAIPRAARLVYVTPSHQFPLGVAMSLERRMPALRAAKQLTDSSGVVPTQAALARFIDQGWLAKHIRKAGREYAVRHERIVAVRRASPQNDECTAVTRRVVRHVPARCGGRGSPVRC